MQNAEHVKKNHSRKEKQVEFKEIREIVLTFFLFKKYTLVRVKLATGVKLGETQKVRKKTNLYNQRTGERNYERERERESVVCVHLRVLRVYVRVSVS